VVSAVHCWQMILDGFSTLAGIIFLICLVRQ
jgi:hypothetical protein